MTATGTALGPTVAERARRARGPVLVGALILLTGLVVALLTTASPAGDLRPDSAEPGGSLALASVLARQGVRVDTITGTEGLADAEPGQTILVADPAALSTPQRDALARSPADLVLVRPDERSLTTLAPGVLAAPTELPEPTEPACPVRAALLAGPVDLAGAAYTAPPEAVRCYLTGTGGAASLVGLAVGGRGVTVLGDATPLTNDALDERGNAALALDLLGAHPRLLWYLPVPPPAEPGQERGLIELLGPGWLWGPVQLLIAGVAAALWRGRRLGPLVTEDLPVVVPAGETVRGRARLYRRAGARDRAAAALRTEARRDLTGRLGLPRTAPVPAIADAVAARTGRHPGEVAALLAGPPPGDDPGLVALAAELDRMVSHVHRG